MSSDYQRIASRLAENGYHPLPVMPGTKVPGDHSRGFWRHMPGWAKFCANKPPDFQFSRWERWPDAGVCVTHGRIVGIDVDTDRQDIMQAVAEAIEASPVKRRGAKGYMGYYRPGGGLDEYSGRVRWYDGETVVFEILLHGTQSVIPPTIHPDTLQPYQWLTEDTLEDTDIEELPVLTGDDIKKIDAALSKLGLKRAKPRKVREGGYGQFNGEPAAHDLEVSAWRSLNNRALEPEAIDKWWPALEMPGTRQRGPGSWESVPWWRPSSSGRETSERNPNLKVVPSGIVDFGADRAYTPIDVVMSHKEWVDQPSLAKEWLEEYVRSEKIEVMDLSGQLERAKKSEASLATAEPEPVPADPSAPDKASLPLRSHFKYPKVLPAAKSHKRARSIHDVNAKEFDAIVPRTDAPFPVQSAASQCPGLLGELAQYLDAASTTCTEAGGLAVALPTLGAIMGRAYETETGLRTNIYSVALGRSGTGKTSLVNPAKEVMMLAGLKNNLGQDDIASGSGLIAMLTSHPSRVCFLDEFGHMLQQLASHNSGPHTKEIISLFTKFYSVANTLYTGKAYAGRAPEPIDCPNLCLFAMATPDQFWRAFGSSSLEDGSIARYLLFPLNYAGPKERDMSFQDELVDKIKDLCQAMLARVTGNIDRPAVFTAHMSKEANAERLATVQTMDACAIYAEVNNIKGAPAILRRVAENAAKIALISAVGRNPVSPAITEQDFDLGYDLAHWSACRMITNIQEHIADNQHERNINDVERIIKAGGPDGLPWRDVQRKCRHIKPSDFGPIVQWLKTEESIKLVEIGTPGRIKRILVSTKH